MKTFGVILFACFTIGGSFSQSVFGSQEASKRKVPAFDFAVMQEVDLAKRETSHGGTVTYWRRKTCDYQQDQIDCALTLRGFIREAWNIPLSQDYRLDKSKLPPDKTETRTFHLKATMASGTSKDTARLMMRTLLTKQFGLKMHREKRSINVYALVVSKEGNRLKPAKALSTDDSQSQVTFGSFDHSGFITASSLNLDKLASSIEMNSDYDRPVVNDTGLSGQYQIDVRWNKDPARSSSSTFADPGFLPALQRETGLVLEKRLIPVDYLVVDSVSQIYLKRE